MIRPQPLDHHDGGSASLRASIRDHFSKEKLIIFILTVEILILMRVRRGPSCLLLCYAADAHRWRCRGSARHSGAAAIAWARTPGRWRSRRGWRCARGRIAMPMDGLLDPLQSCARLARPAGSTTAHTLSTVAHTERIVTMEKRPLGRTGLQVAVIARRHRCWDEFYRHL